MSYQSVSPEQFLKIKEDNPSVKLIDVRSAVEFRTLRVVGAQHIPMEELRPESIERQSDDEPVYIICQGGVRSRKACENLLMNGVVNLVNVDDGTLGCEKAGLPMERDEEVMSLDRQVKITAGSFVFIGSGLSWLFHPIFILVPAFIGAGLVYSGITNTCGMAMVLTKMPWN